MEPNEYPLKAKLPKNVEAVLNESKKSSDSALKSELLKLSLSSVPDGASTELIVERAQQFYNFIKD